jgi:hypothetical protein
MEILEAFDATGCAHSAAQLVGCDPKTIRYAGSGITDPMPTGPLCRTGSAGACGATVTGPPHAA